MDKPLAGEESPRVDPLALAFLPSPEKSGRSSKESVQGCALDLVLSPSPSKETLESDDAKDEGGPCPPYVLSHWPYADSAGTYLGQLWVHAHTHARA